MCTSYLKSGISASIPKSSLQTILSSCQAHTTLGPPLASRQESRAPIGNSVSSS